MTRTEVALVTGASSGLGLATAQALAEAGFEVWATVRSETAALPGDARVEVADVRDRAALRAVVSRIEAERGHVDVLVNNAGVGSFGAVEATGDEELALVMDTNFAAAVALSRLVLPGMRRAGGGTIVNIGSVDAWLPGRPLRWAYAASKHALGVFSEALALEVAGFGIRVRQLDPGFHASRIRQNRLARTGSDPVDDEIAAAYGPLVEAVDRSMKAGGGAAAPPGQVADAVLAAVRDRAVHPVRRLVGADAQTAVAAEAGLDEAASAAAYWRALGLPDAPP